MARLPKSIIRKYGISKKAWRVFRGARKRVRRGAKKTVRRVRRRMARKRRRRSSGFNIRTLEKFIALGAFVAPGIDEGMKYESMADKLIGGLTCYAGWNHGAKAWSWEMLAKAWTPYLMFNLASKGVHKLNSIIRRI